MVVIDHWRAGNKSQILWAGWEESGIAEFHKKGVDLYLLSTLYSCVAWDSFLNLSVPGLACCLLPYECGKRHL